MKATLLVLFLIVVIVGLSSLDLFDQQGDSVMPSFGRTPSSWSALVNDWSRLVPQFPNDTVTPQIGAFTPGAAMTVTKTETVTTNGPLHPNGPSSPQACTANRSLTALGAATTYTLPIAARRSLTTPLFGTEDREGHSGACVLN